MKNKNQSKCNGFTVPEVARALNVSTKKVQALIVNGSLESYRLENGDHRVTREALDVFEQKCLVFGNFERLIARIAGGKN